MLEKLTENKSLWEYLKHTTKPIYLYGMGDGALKIMDAMEKQNIPYEGVFASDDFVRGHSFCGKKIMRFSEVKAIHPNFIALLAFATQKEMMLNTLFNMQNECELYAPDVPVVKTDDFLFDTDYVYNHQEELNTVYNLLADEKSKQTFIDVINFKISGKIDYLKKCQSDIDEVYQNLIKPVSSDIYIDLGAYNGDTVSEFLSYTNYKINKIIAFEPDIKNYKKLLKRIEDENIINIEPYHIGSWDEEDILYFANKGGRNSKLILDGKIAVNVNSVDNILKGEKATVIKFDVEGAEKESINGCKQTIQTYKPRLMLSAYHRNEDLFALPLQVLSINPKYKVYLRHHPYIPAWETNFYFI